MSARFTRTGSIIQARHKWNTYANVRYYCLVGKNAGGRTVWELNGRVGEKAVIICLIKSNYIIVSASNIYIYAYIGPHPTQISYLHSDKCTDIRKSVALRKHSPIIGPRRETETEQHYLDSPSVRVRRDRIHGLQNTLLRLQSQCVRFTFATPRPSNKTHTNTFMYALNICPYMYIVHVYTRHGGI